jgi:3D-(3,5/4)-trihydroxycyclohexane-1,2-dione acylhydrolase (decyclizing)
VNDCFRPVARFFDRITRPEQLLTALPEAMRVLTSPVETGAVVLALPQDVQAHAWDFPERFFEEREWRIERPPAGRAPDRGGCRGDPRRGAAAADRGRRRSLQRGGGGAARTRASDRHPVAETFAGKGAVQSDEWFQLGGLGLEGNPAASRVAMDADLVLAVGTRLTDFATGSNSSSSTRTSASSRSTPGPRRREAGRAARGRRRARRARRAFAPHSAAGRRARSTEPRSSGALAEWLTRSVALASTSTGEAMSQAS